MKKEKPKKKHLLSKIIIGFFIICVLGAAFGGGDGDKPEKTSAPAVKQEQTVSQEQEKTAQPAAQEQQETAQQENTAPAEEAAQAGAIRPELIEFLEAYESFMDEYCEFMENYDASDAALLAEYTDLFAKYSDFLEKAEKWDEEDLTDEETIYYVEVMNRVNEKLLKVSQGL